MRAKEFIVESNNIASAEQVWNYVGGIHPKDQQGGGFLKSLVMLNPQYELKRIPLSSLHIPDDPKDEVNDPYGRAMSVDVDHAREYSQHYIDKKPLVVDSQGHILDGAHRAWAAAELLKKTDIMAWVPVKSRTATPQDLELRKQFTGQGVAEGGAETSWSNDTDTITLQDILELTKHIKQINLPINDNLKSKLLHWEGNPEEIERVNQVTVSNQFPILIMVDEQGQIEWILDGNHRLHKAIQSQAKTIPAKLIRPSNLDDKANKIFNIKEQGVAEGSNEPTLQLGPQLYTPHPKNLDESMKPKAALWTSTASGGNNGYSSAWVEWAKSEMPQWVGHSGFLYDVSPGARILTINSDRDAMRVANKYGMNTTDIMDLFMYMPWKKIAKDYDAIHHVPANRGADLFMHGWDVESTAWFNPKMLLNKRKVPILASKQGVAENFADGRNPEDKGDSARHGIPKGATMAQLERASHAKGRKGQLARWQLNMRRGQKK